MKKIAIILCIFVLYLVTSVPVGLFLYSLKSDNGINIFSKTGFHSYMYCLEQQVNTAMAQEKANTDDTKN